MFPVSNTLTRVAGLGLLAVIWPGLIGLVWLHRFFRLGLLAFTGLCALFLCLPARQSDSASLRQAYVAGLTRYEGVAFIWGGESPKGVDCSGLIRRGLVDSLFLQGIQTFDAGLVRNSIRLWWHDCPARDLGEGREVTSRLFSTPSVNDLDQAKILPGDLAVTSSGSHVMAFLGDHHWIEADPDIGRVIIVQVPSKNPWFRARMNVVRWNMFGS